MKYKRILLKISGEALLGSQQFGIDQEPVAMIANEIKKVTELGAQVAVVVGGGNIFRGMKNSAKLGMDQASGDYVGMLATVMNAIALQSALNQIGVQCRVQSAIAMNQIAEQAQGYSSFGKRSSCNFCCRYGKSVLYDRYCCSVESIGNKRRCYVDGQKRS